MDCRCNELVETTGNEARAYLHHLTEVRSEYGGWIREYVCAGTGVHWFKDNLESYRQGGGTLRLRRMDAVSPDEIPLAWLPEYKEGDEARCRCNELVELHGLRAAEYRTHHLKEASVAAGRWIIEYICPLTGVRWLKPSP